MAFTKLTINFTVVGILSFLCAACSTYPEKAEKMRNAFRNGNPQTATKIAQEETSKASKNDKLLWQLDLGTSLRASGKIAESQKVFNFAFDTLNFWDRKANILLSSEALATLTNLSALPYRGKGSDRIMLHTYRALNFLELGQTEEARNALNAAFREQEEAVVRNEKEIIAAQKSASKEKLNIDSTLQNKELAKGLSTLEKSSNSIKAYADYVNPFTTWLHGIYFLHTGKDQGDFERARKSLERVAKMLPANKYIEDDLERLKTYPPKNTPLTYVIFEYGLAPTLKEERIDFLFPIFLSGTKSTIVPFSLALPKLIPGDSNPPKLSANSILSCELCDMNRVIKTEYKNTFPTILTRTLITSFTKAIASATANVAAANMGNNDAAPFVQLITLISTSLYTYGTSEADCRAWQTLPAQFSLVRLATPSDRNLNITIGNTTQRLELIPGKINIVLVKFLKNTPPKISQFTLK